MRLDIRRASELKEQVRGKKNEQDMQIYQEKLWQHPSMSFSSRSAIPKKTADI